MANYFELEHPELATQFKNIGLAREDVKGLPEEVKNALASGSLSPLMLLNIKQDNKTYLLPAKIQIAINEKTNQPELLIYGVNKKLDNSLNLDKKNLDYLKKGDILLLQEKDQTYLIQLDPATKYILKMPAKELDNKLNKVEKILDIELGKEQRDRIKEGKPIKLDVGGEDVTIGVDLRAPNNFRQLHGDMKEWERQKAIDYDIAHPEYLGLVKTDENRWEYYMIQTKGYDAEKFLKQSPAQVKSSGMKL